jgi:hypothetical protein
MRFKTIFHAAFSLLAVLFLAPATLANAQEPAYLHAISDLRTAREYLKMDSRPGSAGARDFAIREISRAIDEIKMAARDDGKNPSVTPPPQSEVNPNWPIHSAAKLLREARRDVDHGIDRRENAGLRERSVIHIDKALEALEPFLR